MPIVWTCLVFHSVCASYHLDVFQIRGFAPLFEQAKLRIQREMQARSVVKGVICFFCGTALHAPFNFDMFVVRLLASHRISVGMYNKTHVTGVEQHESGQRRVLEGTQICALPLGFDDMAVVRFSIPITLSFEKLSI